MGDRTDDVPRTVTEDVPNNFGIAMSGGGVRAAFFALGGLMHLVHSGLHRRVVLVGSVSGSSLVNACIAQNTDFSQMAASELDDLATAVAPRLARRGVFFWPGLRRLILPVLLNLVAWPILVLLISTVWKSDVTQGSQFGWAVIIGWGSIAVWLPGTVIFGRRYFQIGDYDKFLRAVAKEANGTKHPRRRKLESLVPSRVLHLFCATELSSGQPFYLGRSIAFSPLYGRGDPDLTIAQAIYASAAFPVGYPPLRIASNRVNLHDGRDDEPPKYLLLTDGGVFNNLASNTFDMRESASSAFLPEASWQVIPSVEVQLIVNASSPPRRVDLPGRLGLGGLRRLRRTMTILHENTLRPRIQLHMEAQRAGESTLVIDVSESPTELCDRLAETRGLSNEARDRISAARELLGRDRTDSEWKEYVNKAARTKTVLSPVGDTAATRLIRLGYLNMAISCAAYFGTGDISQVPAELWFRNLLSQPRPGVS